MTDAEKVEIRTHWEGCWKDPAHHGCAVKEVERLRAENETLRSLVGTVMAIPQMTNSQLAELRVNCLAVIAARGES